MNDIANGVSRQDSCSVTPDGTTLRRYSFSVFEPFAAFSDRRKHRKRCATAKQQQQRYHSGRCGAAGRLSESPTPQTTNLPSDEEIIATIRTSSVGDRFVRLWAGDTSDYRCDHSAADLALCSILARFCDRDAGTIDRLFQRSGLYRDKWERVDYADRTIQKAVDNCERTYSYRVKCPDLSYLERQTFKTTRDSTNAEPSSHIPFCTNRQKIVARSGTDPSDMRVMYVRCKLLTCSYCRQIYNRDRISHFVDILDNHGDELHLLNCDCDDWETVRKRLQRAGCNYVGIKRPSATDDADVQIVVVMDSPVKDSEPVAKQAAKNIITASILDIAPGTSHPILSSKAWRFQANNDKGKFRVLCKTTADESEIKKAANRKRIPIAHFRWEFCDVDGLALTIDPDWSDERVVAFIVACELPPLRIQFRRPERRHLQLCRIQV